MLLVGAENFSNIFFDFQPGRHHFMTAPLAFQAKIHANAQHLKAFAAAGVGLFHFQPVSYPNIHAGFLLFQFAADG